MGDKVEPRRKWIESHVQFTLEEDGSLLDNKEEATTVPVAEQNEMEETTDGVKMISLFDE